MKTNYHTHHALCRHAEGNVCEYVLEAIKCGFDEIGISDHGPINAQAFPRMSLLEFENIYLKELDETIKTYNDKIKIYKGLEIEYIADDIPHYKMLLSKLDYLILGCHYYENKRNLDPYSGYAVIDHVTLNRYTEVIEEALDTKLFKILAHPDLFMNGYHHLDSYAIECVRRICDAAIRNNVLLEFNAAGIRCGRTFEGKPKYPNEEFWKVVEKTNAKVIVNSDCHKPCELDDWAFEKANEEVKKYKLNLVNKLFD